MEKFIDNIVVAQTKRLYETFPDYSLVSSTNMKQHKYNGPAKRHFYMKLLDRPKLIGMLGVLTNNCHFK